MDYKWIYIDKKVMDRELSPEDHLVYVQQWQT